MTESRDAVLVLGMHRSGTSAVARVLNLLGGAISGDLLPADRHNETGYWESEELMRIHQEILAFFGHDWYHALGLPRAWWLDNGHRPFGDAILEVLERDFADAPLFVVKDPRISLLVPLWLDVLERFAARPRFVLSIRHPLEVAASLGRAHGLSPSRSHLLWLRYVLEGERWSRGFPRSIIAYDRLLHDWRSLVPAAFEALRVEWPHSADERAVEIDAFLSPAHRHHAASLDDLDVGAGVPTWVRTTYRAMLGLIDGRTEESLAELDSVHQQLEAADAAFSAELADSLEFHRLNNECYRLAQEVESSREALARERAELERSQGQLAQTSGELDAARAEAAAVRHALEVAEARLAQTLSSRSWRLTAPLRRLRRLLAPAKGSPGDD